jgi:hypothetical protein
MTLASGWYVLKFCDNAKEFMSKLQNTAIIINRGITFIPSYTTPAASACEELDIGGKTDWFLPSINELIALAQFRGQYGIPDSGWFWSSSQANSPFAWFLIFDSGFPGDSRKDGSGNVRAVRAF